MQSREILGLILFFAGCGHSHTGSPCDKDEQCGDGLVCDFHDGKGTCQVPHDHVSGGDTDHHDSTGHDGSTGAVDPTEAATTTQTTSTATSGGTTHDHGTGDGSTTDHGTTTANTTGANAEACTNYCACLATHCTQHSHFPHADAAACEAACAAFTEEESTCWFAYCELATEGGDAQEHYCEHASGSIGLAECE